MQVAPFRARSPPFRDTTQSTPFSVRCAALLHCQPTGFQHSSLLHLRHVPQLLRYRWGALAAAMCLPPALDQPGPGVGVAPAWRSTLATGGCGRRWRTRKHDVGCAWHWLAGGGNGARAHSVLLAWLRSKAGEGANGCWVELYGREVGRAVLVGTPVGGGRGSANTRPTTSRQSRTKTRKINKERKSFVYVCDLCFLPSLSPSASATVAN